MLQIDDTVLSLDVFEEQFKCDLEKCKGHCCVYGDSGAPLENEEVKLLKELYPEIRPYLQEAGIQAIEKTGTSMIDKDGDEVTPLITDKECAYTIQEHGIYFCGIERAYLDEKIRFRKPVSCHLFPVRIKNYTGFTGVNYEKWNICRSGRVCGKSEDLPVYKFVKDSLVRKFGKEWYEKVRIAGEEIFRKNS